jgi:hypothetical protein
VSVALLRPRLCELGKIKIGRKGAERQKQGGGTYRIPEKLDHFLITTLQRDAKDDLVLDEALMAQLREEHGDEDGKIRRLPVAVLSNDVEEIIQASYVAYNGRTCLARCEDGKTVTRFVKDGKFLDPPIEEPWRDEFLALKNSSGGPIWKLHTKFACVIASKSANWGGVYFLRTTSQITGEQLLGSLMHVRDLTCGVLRGVPLRLVVRPIQVTPEGKPTTVYVVHLELAGTDLGEVQRLALERRRHELDYAKEMAATERQYRALLKAPGVDEDEIEADDVSSEFHPPEPAAASLAPAPGQGKLDALTTKLATPAAIAVAPADPDPSTDEHPFGKAPVSASAEAALSGKPQPAAAPAPAAKPATRRRF